ncbi:low molecular weight protein arginine phosphatase [Elusimicrobiota bacterium]
MEVKKITFVCTGNTCRSVMAQKIFERLIKDTELSELETDSAGTAAMPYYAIVGEIKQVMDENEVDYSGHIPKKIDQDILKDSSIVLVMTETHREDILMAYGDYDDKIFLLSEYAEGDIKDIADPIGMGVETYRESFIEIKDYIEKIIERLKNEIKG